MQKIAEETPVTADVKKNTEMDNTVTQPGCNT